MSARKMTVEVGGVPVTGSAADIKSLIAEMAGTGGMSDSALASLGLYNSTKRGIIAIDSMNERHLRNAIAVRLEEWAKDFRATHYTKHGSKSNRDWAQVIREGITEDAVAYALLAELLGRE